MERVKNFQIRGVPGTVSRLNFDGRLVDFWNPNAPTDHLLIAHDGQNIFDRSTATRRSTWQMAQSALRVSAELGITPPAIIGIFHSRSAMNPWGRILDLSPQDPFQNGVVSPEVNEEISVENLRGNFYLEQITEVIAPEICHELNLNIDRLDKAVIGSSMGGLASLYAIGKRPDFFGTALALSPHWPAGEFPLVDALLDSIPKPGGHKIWMSRGTRGRDREYEIFQDYADQRMIQSGWQEGDDFITRVYKKSGHNEKSWARYLDQPMKFWLDSDFRASGV